MQCTSCKSSAPSMATRSSEPQFLCRSPGPACQSCRVLRLLQSLQVDSLMLQEWFVLQPLSWSGNPQQGGGNMHHGCTAPVSCACPLSPKKTIYPPRDRHFCFKEKPKQNPQQSALQLQELSPGERAPWSLSIPSTHLPSHRGPLASVRDLHSQELPPTKPPPTKAAIPPGTHMSLCPPTLEAPLGEGKGHGYTWLTRSR